MWNARKENKQLPSLGQWLSIRLLTRKQGWTESQRLMMRRASRYHGVRSTVVAVLVLVISVLVLMERQRVSDRLNAARANNLVERLEENEVIQVPQVIAEIEQHRQWVDPILREKLTLAPENSKQKLNLSLGLLDVDPGQAEYIFTRLLDVVPEAVPVLRDSLGISSSRGCGRPSKTRQRARSKPG
jgi:hypothetical protein